MDCSFLAHLLLQIIADIGIVKIWHHKLLAKNMRRDRFQQILRNFPFTDNKIDKKTPELNCYRSLKNWKRDLFSMEVYLNFTLLMKAWSHTLENTIQNNLYWENLLDLDSRLFKKRLLAFIWVLSSEALTKRFHRLRSSDRVWKESGPPCAIYKK